MGSMKIWTGSAWEIASTQGPAGPVAVASVDGRTGTVVLTDKYLQLTGGTMTGAITLTDGANLVAGISTGTKIGTATTQKIGFWNATPQAQSSGWTVTAGYGANKGFNPQSTTLSVVASTLGTLIDTLKAYGLLG